jgi:hypothetical protein
MAWPVRCCALGLLIGRAPGASLNVILREKSLFAHRHMARVRQTPEELGLGLADVAPGSYSSFDSNRCLDLGAKGFPLPVFSLLQKADWDVFEYFDSLQASGYAEDSLRMTGPKDAILKSDCMKVRGGGRSGRVKHIFVGDSQMMSLRNALHRLNKCPDIFWSSGEEEAMFTKPMGRLHSNTQQVPDERVPHGCTDEGIASFIYWDAYAEPGLPIAAIKREIEFLALDPIDGDTVVVWLGSNYIRPSRRKSTLLTAIEEMHSLGVKLVWDSPTYQDAALMAAASTHNAGHDEETKVPLVFTAIAQRKARGEVGYSQYADEKAVIKEQVGEVPMTKRWQLTNRFRGLACDGIHTDMRGRDPMYDQPCPIGPRPKYGASTYCNWVEPIKANLTEHCPAALGVDDMVLQSGLYALCVAHEKPFCYQHADKIG